MTPVSALPLTLLSGGGDRLSPQQWYKNPANPCPVREIRESEFPNRPLTVIYNRQLTTTRTEVRAEVVNG
jgi:hypothetical protein